MMIPSTKTDVTTAHSTTDALVTTVDTVVDNIYATTPRIVSRDTANLPQSTQTPYFTVTGRVLITQIVGEVTTVIETQDCDLDIRANPTV
jgi:hypothetical protein